jgi:hypothetical protein
VLYLLIARKEKKPRDMYKKETRDMYKKRNLATNICSRRRGFVFSFLRATQRLLAICLLRVVCCLKPPPQKPPPQNRLHKNRLRALFLARFAFSKAMGASSGSL